jgi:hypothetical protein
MVGLQNVLHSNQDTQALIESYHGALKRWFSIETKRFRGQHIDWLVWQLTTIVAWHYMHTFEMKKRGIIKNKVLEHIKNTSVEKVLLILTANVKWPSLESRGVWIMMSQGTPNHMYEVKHPFKEYVNCTCEWALCGNLCKHQVAILFWLT